MMINEHIKDYSPEEKCPKGKTKCKYGYLDCKYFSGRFKTYPCDKDFKKKVEEGHKKELQERKKINVNYDYNQRINKRRDKDVK